MRSTAATRFGGAEGPLSLNGEVATATLGADSRRGRWHADGWIRVPAALSNWYNQDKGVGNRY